MSPGAQFAWYVAAVVLFVLAAVASAFPPPRAYPHIALSLLLVAAGLACGFVPLMWTAHLAT